MIHTIQIDIPQNDSTEVISMVLSTGNRDVTILMHYTDYLDLIADGFFIRNGEKPDSAGVINTTKVYTAP